MNIIKITAASTQSRMPSVNQQNMTFNADNIVRWEKAQSGGNEIVHFHTSDGNSYYAYMPLAEFEQLLQSKN